MVFEFATFRESLEHVPLFEDLPLVIEPNDVDARPLAISRAVAWCSAGTRIRD
jgi:hypothetical protein